MPKDTSQTFFLNYFQAPLLEFEFGKVVFPWKRALSQTPTKFKNSYI